MLGDKPSICAYLANAKTNSALYNINKDVKTVFCKYQEWVSLMEVFNGWLGDL